MNIGELIEFFVEDVLDSSSEDESDASSRIMVTAPSLIHEHTKMERQVHRGSTRPPKAKCCVIEDPTNPVFTEAMFRQRYQMSRYLFSTILLISMRDYDTYLGYMPDATGKFCFTSYQKCSAAISMLAFGLAGDRLDVYLRMSESTFLEAMYMFS
jgi:hypothetical protein